MHELEEYRLIDFLLFNKIRYSVPEKTPKEVWIRIREQVDLTGRFDLISIDLEDELEARILR